RDDDPQRIPVPGGKRFAVHRIGQQSLGAPGFIDLQAPLEADGVSSPRPSSTIGTPQHPGDGYGRGRGAAQDSEESAGRPSGRAPRISGRIDVWQLRGSVRGTIRPYSMAGWAASSGSNTRTMSSTMGFGMDEAP